MRLVSTCLIAAASALSLAGPVSAQSSWVDPPPRSAAPDRPKAEPVKPEAAKAEPSKSEQASAPARTSPRMARRRPVRVAKRPATRIATARSAARARQLAENRRVPQVVAPAGAAIIAENGATDPRFPVWAGTAQQLAGNYLDATAPDTGSFTARIFGTYASLGPASAAPELRSAKQYASLGNALSTACNAERATCLVQTVVACTTGSAERCELTLAVNFEGQSPRIVAEWLRPIAAQAAF